MVSNKKCEQHGIQQPAGRGCCTRPLAPGKRRYGNHAPPGARGKASRRKRKVLQPPGVNWISALAAGDQKDHTHQSDDGQKTAMSGVQIRKCGDSNRRRQDSNQQHTHSSAAAQSNAIAIEARGEEADGYGQDQRAARPGAGRSQDFATTKPDPQIGTCQSQRPQEEHPDSRR